MTDRELLEAAAKAAGIELTDFHGLLVIPDPKAGCPPWNPLEDDGDALRLAVRHRFHVDIFSATNAEGIEVFPGFVEIWRGDCDPIHTEYVVGSNYEAATRRAIVRAAAAMGAA
jgi:hypothetical protein